jgi:hypothetical protein
LHQSGRIFHIRHGQISRSLRSSRKNKKCHKPRTFSSWRQGIGPSVDRQLINKCLQVCRERCPDTCEKAACSEPLNRPARIINVNYNCVAETPPSCEYLSVMYGGRQSHPGLYKLQVGLTSPVYEREELYSELFR